LTAHYHSHLSTIVEGPTKVDRIFSLSSIGGSVTGTEFGRAQSGSPSSGSGRGGGSPRLESFFSEDAERAAGGEMALDVENVLDSGVNGQEALG
jgi:hypothetical protein